MFQALFPAEFAELWSVGILYGITELPVKLWSPMNLLVCSVLSYLCFLASRRIIGMPFWVLSSLRLLVDSACSHRLRGLPSSSGSPSQLHLRALAPQSPTWARLGRERANLTRPLTPI